jgi:PKD repeat protein
VQFADSSTGPVTTWTWDFGDGGTSNEQNPIHRYQQQGTYNVALTVGGAAGQSDTLLQNGYITVGPPHFADLDADGDADKDDMDIFEACSTGPGITDPPASGCTTTQFASADVDDDNDVDQSDFGIFQRCLSGADVSPVANCAGQ